MRQDQAGPASTVIWEISSNGKVSKLKLTHKDLDMNNPIVNEIRNAWQPTLDSLKKVVETADA
jgi:hypothetical protein